MDSGSAEKIVANIARTARETDAHGLYRERLHPRYSRLFRYGILFVDAAGKSTR